MLSTSKEIVDGGVVLIELPLERLQDSVSRFIVPSASFSDIQALMAQIELRQRALRDIEVIRCRLRVWDDRTVIRMPRRRKGTSARQASFLRLRAESCSRGRLDLIPQVRFDV
jgi:hypothetical protein